MPLTVALEDDGLFILSSYFNGVSHPPGYPIHSFIGYIFTNIPISSVAARVHAVSAVFGALTCSLIWLICQQLTNHRHIAYVASLSFAFSTSFWSQAIIAEVYTLNTFFFFLLFYLAITVYKQEEKPRNNNITNNRLYLIAFIYGLSLCNHWPLIIVSTPGLIVLLLPTLLRKPKLFIYCIPLTLLGLFPYAWMIYNSQSSPEMSFLGPINNWSKFYYFISRQHYAGIDNNLNSDLMDKIYYLGYFFRQLGHQFTWLGFSILTIGFISQFKYLSRRISISLILVFLGNSLLLLIMLNFEYSELFQSIIKVYFLIAYGIAAIWLAFGLGYLLSIISNRLPNQQWISYRLIPISALTLIIIIFLFNFTTNNRHSYSWGEQYARTTLMSLPKNSTLLLGGDISTGTIGYLHYIEGVREDITVLSSRSVLFKNRLFDPMTAIQKDIPLHIKSYTLKSQSDVHTTFFDDDLFNQHHWLTHGYSPNKSNNQNTLHLNSLNSEYLSYVLHTDTNNDAWTFRHRKLILNNATRFIIESINQGRKKAIYNDALNEILVDLNGFLIFVNYIKQKDLLDRFGGLDNLIAQATTLYQKSNETPAQAKYLYFMATIATENNDTDTATNYYLKSIKRWTDRKNPSLQKLKSIYHTSGRALDFQTLLDELKIN